MPTNKNTKPIPVYRNFSVIQYISSPLLRSSTLLVFTDPRYTSQKCSKCKSRHDTHRNKSHFKCVTCGNKLHADLNAAINIRDNFLISLLPQKTEGQGAVNHPNISAGNANILSITC